MFHECIPDRKWRTYCRLVEEKKAIQDPLLHQIEQVRQGTLKDEEVEYVLDLIEDAHHRDNVIAFLLSGATTMMVSTWLQIPVSVLDMFCELCFDKSEFRNKLEWRSYALKYADQCARPENSDLIRSAIVLGPQYMMYHFQQGEEVVPLDPRDLAQNLIQQAFHFSRVARGNSINSAASKEALRWLNTASKLLAGFDKLPIDESNTDESEAWVAIEEVKISQSVEECGLSKDTVMH